MKRMIGIILAVVAAVFLVSTFAATQGGGNMNSRFNDSNATFRSVTATTGTITTGTITTLTATTANVTTLNKGGSAVSSTAAELNLLNSVTAGTVKASKAIVAGSSKDIDSLTVKYFKANQPILNIASELAAACTLYASGTYRGSGTVFNARTLGVAKTTCVLDSNCVVGTYVDAYVARADSFRFAVTGTDSLCLADGTTSGGGVIGTVAGSCRLVKMAARKWMLMWATGTWTVSKT